MPSGRRVFVPGLDALHRITGLLLAERVSETARVLVLGAGGGAEILALAQMYPGWRFVGVDPAGEMLRLAERSLGALMERVALVKGVIDDAPIGPFDAAVCLLTLHFFDAAERTRMVQRI
jgi:tRNA (cmo5U34)-methyltransferase